MAKIVLTIEDQLLENGRSSVSVVSDPTWGEILKSIAETEPTPAQDYAQIAFHRIRYTSKVLSLEERVKANPLDFDSRKLLDDARACEAEISRIEKKLLALV